jgi:hypothetical protein
MHLEALNSVIIINKQRNFVVERPEEEGYPRSKLLMVLLALALLQSSFL